MKKLILCSMLSALTLPVLAQTGQEVETVTISNAAPKIEVPSASDQMSSDRFYQYKGSYELSNGQSLSLFERGKFKYAQVSDQPRHRIIATGRNTFVALDRELKMRIDLKEDGDFTGELLMRIPAQVQAHATADPEGVLILALKREVEKSSYN